MKTLKYGTWLLAIFLTVILLSGCQTLTPQVPDIQKNLTDSQRKELKEKYSVTTSGNAFFGMNGKQDAKQYPISTFGPVIKSISPDGKKKFDSGSTKGLFSSLMARVGGFCTGYFIGYALSSKEIPTTNYIILGGGVGALVTSYFLSEGATKDFNSAVEKYNEDLDKKLSMN